MSFYLGLQEPAREFHTDLGDVTVSMHDVPARTAYCSIQKNEKNTRRCSYALQREGPYINFLSDGSVSKNAPLFYVQFAFATPQNDDCCFSFQCRLAWRTER